MVDNNKTPNHVAIIMDGNGRWARNRGLDRSYGHVEGVDSVVSAIESALEFGIKYLTIYAFSTENWNRPVREVESIMSLFCTTILEELDNLTKNEVRVRFMGDFSKLKKEVIDSIEMCERITSTNRKLTLVVAINYSSRWEIERMVKQLSLKVKNGDMAIEDIDCKSIGKEMFLGDVPDPDLIVRTSGECRLSNFLLWQAAYSELYFTDVLWPDFRKEEFKCAIEHYASRDRRYGAL